MGFKATLELTGDGCTFGELLGFASLGRRLGLQYHDRLTLEVDPESREVIGLTLTSDVVSNLAPMETTFDQRDELVEALNDIINSEGDARGKLVHLSEIRDRLRDEG